MAARRILLALIGLLSVIILVGGAGVAALAYLSLAAPRPAERLLVVGADQSLSLVGRDGRLSQIAADASPDLFRYPALAPDGERIAYISQDAGGTALHTLHLRTGARTELYRSAANPPLYVTWSPDGRNVSFLSNRSDGGLGVHIVAADGSRDSDLIGTSAGSSYFAWQPDGSTLLLHIGGSSFESGRVATFRPGSAEPISELVNPGFFQAPAWSRDGASFFYVAQPPISGAPAPEKIESVLTRVAADGSGPVELARERMAAMLFLRAPASDDIAYTTIGPGGFGPLKIVDPAGGAPRLLSAATDVVPAFFWSPDGRQIAYLAAAGSATGGPLQLRWYVVDRSGGAPRALATFTPSQAFAAQISFFDAYAFAFDLWSPDGRSLVYGASDGIYVLDVAGGSATRRADGVLAMWLRRE